MNCPARVVVMIVALCAAPAAAFAQASDTQSPAGQPPNGQAQAGVQIPPADQPPATQEQVAQTQVYYHAGAWDAFSGRNSQGGPICGVESINPVDNRNLSIMFNIGGEITTFLASKPDWSIPEGTQVAVVMQVGLDTPWTLRANGHGHNIEWTLDRDAIQRFDQQFRAAQSMTLTFPDGNEPPWTILLAGSTAISDTFGRCVTDLTRQVQYAPPPVNSSAAPQGATQPFTPPAGAQPPAH